MLITERDDSIFLFMQENYGKTFEHVLAKTFFSSLETARKRVSLLIKEGYLERKKSGLASPASIICFGPEANGYFKAVHGELPKRGKIASFKINHEINQQIAHYWLKSLPDVNVKRTVEVLDNRHYQHVPDLILQKNDKFFYFEIELNKKHISRYNSIISSLHKNANLEKVIYIVKDGEIEKFMKYMPKWRKLHFCTLFELIESIRTNGKIGNILKTQQSLDLQE